MKIMFNPIALLLLCWLVWMIAPVDCVLADRSSDMFTTLVSPIAVGLIPIVIPIGEAEMMPDLPETLFQSWIHAREEDQGGVMVYRPAHYPLPPARGREGMEFHSNGEFVQLGIGATDRRQRTPGHWRATGANQIEVSLPAPQTATYTLTVIECNENVLKVRQQ